MSVFDLIILVIALGFALRGAMKGMVSQIVSVSSLIVCWLVASRFAFIFAPSIPAEAPWNKIGAMAVLFVVTMLVIWFLHERLEKKLKDWKLERLNALLGGVLGFVKGLALCLILTFFCVTLCETTRTMVFQSKSGKFLTASITKIGAFVPKDSSELLQTQLALFNAKVSGEEPSGLSPEENSLQKMLDDGNLSIADGQQGFGKVLTRSHELLQEAQRLQSKLQGQKSKAVSLLDAVGKFFWGEKAAEEKTKTSTQDTAVTPAANSGTPKTEPQALLFSSSQEPQRVLQPPKESAASFPETVREPLDSALNPAPRTVQPIPLLSRPTPAYQEETFFARPAESNPDRGNRTENKPDPNYVPPSMQDLSTLLPSSSMPSKTEQNGSTEQAIMIPSSAASFHLSRAPTESPQFLPPSSVAPAVPATRYSPRQK